MKKIPQTFERAVANASEIYSGDLNPEGEV